MLRYGMLFVGAVIGTGYVAGTILIHIFQTAGF